MLKTDQDSSGQSFDVSQVASLRKKVAHAAISLNFIGIISAIEVWVLLQPFGQIFSIIGALLTCSCAFLISKRMRSGRIWAARLATAWLLFFLAFIALDAVPKSLKNEVTVYKIIGGMLFLAPPYFLARGLIAFAYYKGRSADMQPTALSLSPFEGRRTRPSFVNKTSIVAIFLLFLSPLPYLFLWLGQVGKVHFYRDLAEALGFYTAVTLVSLIFIRWCAQIYRRARRAAMLPGWLAYEEGPAPDCPLSPLFSG